MAEVRRSPDALHDAVRWVRRHPDLLLLLAAGAVVLALRGKAAWPRVLGAVLARVAASVAP